MNPHRLTYSPVDHYEPGDRARFAREDRESTAQERSESRTDAIEARQIGITLADTAAEIFGLGSVPR